MADILLLLKRTVFLPKGSPGIFSINDIKVDIRNPEIKGENGKIYCLGDCDILLEYLSQDTEKDIKRGIMLGEDAISKNSEPRPWQAMITLPFALAEEGEMVCPPLSQIEVTDVKWFVVAPRAMELEVTIKLLVEEDQLQASAEMEGALEECINQEVRTKTPLDNYEEIYMEDQIYIGLDDAEKYQELAENDDECSMDLSSPVVEKAEEQEEEDELFIEKMMKETEYCDEDELIDIEYHEEVLEAEVEFDNVEEDGTVENEIISAKENENSAEDVLLFKDTLGLDLSNSQAKLAEEISKIPQDIGQGEAVEVKVEKEVVIKREVPLMEKPTVKEPETKSKSDGIKSNQFNMRLCRVLEGDDLESIALRMNVSARSLANRNKISDNDLKAGMYLIIPR